MGFRNSYAGDAAAGCPFFAAEFLIRDRFYLVMPQTPAFLSDRDGEYCLLPDCFWKRDRVEAEKKYKSVTKTFTNNSVFDAFFDRPQAIILLKIYLWHVYARK